MISTRTCPRCRKGIYRTIDEAIRAINERLIAGAPPLIWYPCPYDLTVYHLTRQRRA